jgi:hypothetical protein
MKLLSGCALRGAQKGTRQDLIREFGDQPAGVSMYAEQFLRQLLGTVLWIRQKERWPRY